jgi:hypothetical protein
MNATCGADARSQGAELLLGGGAEPSIRDRHTGVEEVQVSSAAANSREGTATRDESRQRSLARGRQVVFREVNDQIHRLAQEWAREGELELVCECADGDCTERVVMAVSDYEALRRFPTRFIVKPGHVTSDAERLTEDRGAIRYISDGSRRGAES